MISADLLLHPSGVAFDDSEGDGRRAWWDGGGGSQAFQGGGDPLADPAQVGGAADVQLGAQLGLVGAAEQPDQGALDAADAFQVIFDAVGQRRTGPRAAS